jgi:hypothetical protein
MTSRSELQLHPLGEAQQSATITTARCVGGGHLRTLDGEETDLIIHSLHNIGDTEDSFLVCFMEFEVHAGLDVLNTTNNKPWN